MSTPVVTAVIATYRAGEYLRYAIESALAQTRGDLEVIVSDDADDHEVRRLAESFDDSRVRYRSNAHRLGPAGNHWAAMVAARGRYIAILNHDDLWRPEYLAAAVPVLDSTPAAVLLFCDHDVIDQTGQSLPGQAEQLNKRWGRDELSEGLYVPFTELVIRQSIPIAMGCLFRRDAIDVKDLREVGPAYDLWLAIELCLTGLGAYYMKERMTAWRVHPGQITGTRDDSWRRGALACWEAAAKAPAFRPVWHTVRRRLADASCAIGVAHLAAGNQKSAISSALAAIRSRPSHWKAWSILGFCLLPTYVVRVFMSKRATGCSVPNEA